jgi:single-strand DNA-binding protein
MPAVNRVTLVGNLTRDPELRYGSSGTAVARFGVAVNMKRGKDAAGNRKEETLFQDVTCFGMIAENVATNAKKGSHVTVEGRLVTESWDDKATGQKRSKNVVLADVALPGIWKVEAKTQPAPTPAAQDDSEVPF